MTKQGKMFPASHDALYVWRVITHIGSPSLMMPILAIVTLDLWRAGRQAVVYNWMTAFVAAVAATLVTKIMFLGWGIGIARLDFGGISGHTLLATSVLPLLLGWLLEQDQRRLSLAGVICGLLAGAVVGISRVVLGAHSVSEVCIAWLAGLAVSGMLPIALGRSRSFSRPSFAWAAPAILLLALNPTASNYLPSHDWEVRIALLLSGHDRPYTRALRKPVVPGYFL